MMKPVPIIDCHTHMPSIGWEKNRDFFSSVQAAVNYFHSVGIEYAIFNTWEGVLSTTEDELCRGNRAALEIATRMEGSLYPGVAMNPDFPEASLRWLNEFYRRGYRWAGELLTYELRDPCKYTDRRFVKLVEACMELGFVIQLHGEPEVVGLAQMFPDYPLVCSHVGDAAFLKKLVKFDHVRVDISGMAGGLIMGRLESAVEILGVDRILFGSDFTGYDPQAFIARVKKVIPDSGEQQKVFRGNLLCLLESMGVNLYDIQGVS